MWQSPAAKSFVLGSPETPYDIKTQANIGYLMITTKKIIDKALRKVTDKDSRDVLNDMKACASSVSRSDSLTFRKSCLERLLQLKQKHFPDEDWKSKNSNGNYEYFSNVIDTANREVMKQMDFKKYSKFSVEEITKESEENEQIHAQMKTATMQATFFPIPDDTEREDDLFAGCEKQVERNAKKYKNSYSMDHAKNYMDIGKTKRTEKINKGRHPQSDSSKSVFSSSSSSAAHKNKQVVPDLDAYADVSGLNASGKSVEQHGFSSGGGALKNSFFLMSPGATAQQKRQFKLSNLIAQTEDQKLDFHDVYKNVPEYQGVAHRRHAVKTDLQKLLRLDKSGTEKYKWKTEKYITCDKNSCESINNCSDNGTRYILVDKVKQRMGH